MFAADCGSVATAKILVAHGAQMDETNSEGKTARDLAERNRHARFLAYVRERF
jgi:ankyrin repeat protein